MSALPTWRVFGSAGPAGCAACRMTRSGWGCEHGIDAYAAGCRGRVGGAGVGTALGAAGGLALDLAPELGRWLFGPGAAPVIQAVQGAVAAAAGTDDPAAQAIALQDPARAGALRVQLAQIAADRARRRRGRLHRAAHRCARGRGGRARPWPCRWPAPAARSPGGAPVVSVVVLLTFGVVVSLVLFHQVPPGSEAVLNVLLGTLGAMATSVVGYWVGSSIGSVRKDERLARRDG